MTSRRTRSSRPLSRVDAALAHEGRLARRLARLGFEVMTNVPTPQGRTCDLVAVSDGLRLHIHVKGIFLDDTSSRRTPLPRALSSLSQVKRRLLVEVAWRQGSRPAQCAHAVLELRRFLLRASLGDEHIVHAADGGVLARCRVRAPHEGSQVIVVAGIAPSPELAIARIRRSLRKAHAQFLPGGENIIVAHGPPRSRWLFEQALLGTPIERWDRFPRRGERVAIGRSADGFWSRRAIPESRVAVWEREGTSCRERTVFGRNRLSERLRATLEMLFPPMAQGLGPSRRRR